MKKSLWSFRTRLGRRHDIHTFVAITVALVTCYTTTDPVLSFLGFTEGTLRSWLEAFYIAPFFVLAIWVAALLNRED